MTSPAPSTGVYEPQRFTVKVGDTECLLRGTPVWPIADILEFESQLEPGSDDGSPGLDPQLAADLLDARMIPPPRPRRRRQRAVSSRAVFYATAGE